mmetsp:Transcript_2959/g.7497  ORF Transcript_2959/g.7497 Transcript_2959/m.7497 type:complete len:155 (+) Transcript_2959:1685-2149(+)
MRHGRSQEGFGDLLHLPQDHSRYFLGREFFGGALSVDVGDLHGGLPPLVGYDVERHELLVGLDGGVVDLASDEALYVEYSVGGILRRLVLGGVADETAPARLGLEGDVGRRDPVAELVRADFDAAVAPHGHAGVGRSEIDPDARPVALPPATRT